MLLMLLGCGPAALETNASDAIDASDPSPTGGVSHPVAVTPPAERSLEERLESFLSLADAAGFDTAVGAYGFLSAVDCCDPGDTCYGNNPASPYGYAHLPPGPGQTAVDTGTEIDGNRSEFHLRADESVVLIGATPPEVRYFGFRSHLARHRFPGDAVSRMVLGTLGPDLNIHEVVRQRHTLDVFEKPMAVVTTADAGTEVRVEELLRSAGFPGTEIHRDRIGAELATFGLDESADTFSLISRVAVFAHPDAEDAYRADPGIVPVRLTPRVAAAPQPHPVEPLPVRGSGTDEDSWRSAVDDLRYAILERFPDLAAERDSMNSKGVITYDCLETGKVCGDLSSRIFLRTPTFALPSDGSFLVAYGTNHERTGKTTYSSFAVQAFEHNVGLSAVESDAMPGSASWFLPDHPRVDDLYAIVVARDCTQFPGATCIEVPTGCPGVEENDELYVMARLYVDPLSGAAPLEAEVVADRTILFRPEAP